MKCVICKHGETCSGEVSVTLQRDGMTIIFKNVPAEICANCGESYIDEKISQQILRTAEEIARAGVEIDVRKYSGIPV